MFETVTGDDDSTRISTSRILKKFWLRFEGLRLEDPTSGNRKNYSSLRENFCGHITLNIRPYYSLYCTLCSEQLSQRPIKLPDTKDKLKAKITEEHTIVNKKTVEIASRRSWSPLEALVEYIGEFLKHLIYCVLRYFHAICWLVGLLFFFFLHFMAYQPV